MIDFNRTPTTLSLLFSKIDSWKGPTPGTAFYLSALAHTINVL